LQRSLELVLFDHRLFPAEIMSLITDNALARPPVDPAAAERVSFAATTTFPVHVHAGQAALAKAAASDPLSNVALTKREQQIVDCLVCGLPNKGIARELNITEATVKVYVKGLLRKIKVRNRTQVAIWALQQSRPLSADRVAAAVSALGGPVELRSEPLAPESPVMVGERRPSPTMTT
jgi:DNA-binding NarL/FixJ family response regulator